MRSLAHQEKVSLGTIQGQLLQACKSLPHNADLTREFGKRYSGILLVDGKFIKVKSYQRKIPCIYGIDYLTHDIVHFVLAPSENYQAALSFFRSLRLTGYPLKTLVCDDNLSFRLAVTKVYPKTIVQLCQNHYKENIRRDLRTLNIDPKVSTFMVDIENLFSHRRSREEFAFVARRIIARHPNQEYLKWLIDMEQKQNLLLAYNQDKKIPHTTNLIECFNSHLQGRLKTIKCFEKLSTAKLWLNAYFIYRRLKPFTDCAGRFKHLNGYCSLQMVVENQSQFIKLKQKLR